MRSGSATQSETADDRAVTLDVGLLEVVQETTALADEEQQPASAVVVVLVLLEVFGEVRDAVAQERDLHLGGSGVALSGGVLGDDLVLGCCVSTDRHVELPIFRLVARRAGACSPGHSGIRGRCTAEVARWGNTQGYQRVGTKDESGGGVAEAQPSAGVAGSRHGDR